MITIKQKAVKVFPFRPSAVIHWSPDVELPYSMISLLTRGLRKKLRKYCLTSKNYQRPVAFASKEPCEKTRMMQESRWRIRVRVQETQRRAFWLGCGKKCAPPHKSEREQRRGEESVPGPGFEADTANLALTLSAIEGINSTRIDFFCGCTCQSMTQTPRWRCKSFLKREWKEDLPSFWLNWRHDDRRSWSRRSFVWKRCIAEPSLPKYKSRQRSTKLQWSRGWKKQIMFFRERCRTT